MLEAFFPPHDLPGDRNTQFQSNLLPACEVGVTNEGRDLWTGKLALRRTPGDNPRTGLPAELL